MRIAGSRLARLALLLPLMALFGCQSISSTPGSPVAPQPPGMNLAGKWDFYMRSESSTTEIVHGMLVIDEETCPDNADTCPISGYVEFVISSTKQRFAISGFSYPKTPLVRFSYDTELVFGELIHVVVEFDSFPKRSVPARAMVGYAVKFNQKSPGTEYIDTPVLDTAGKGMVIEAGRTSAWPMIP